MAKILQATLLLLIPFFTFAQQVKVEGYFLQDSAKLGERVGYVLKAQYPESYQMLFPDSSYNFGEQVLLEKQVFATATTEGVTVDSAVYFLSNFSLDPSIYVALPVYEILPYDSIPHFPLEAELKLKLTIDTIPEQLQFRENNVYQPLEKQTNWIILGLWTGGVLVILLLVYLLFAKRIQKYLKERGEKRRWKRFEARWKKQTEELNSNPSIQLADELIGNWKSYLEHLTREPYQEWTSSEISAKLEDKKVFDALRGIDLIIYAGQTEQSKEATDYLLELSRKTYENKVNQIKHERASK
ncbi:hypothetical protein [Algoriphagus namhaensis]